MKTTCSTNSSAPVSTACASPPKRTTRAARHGYLESANFERFVYDLVAATATACAPASRKWNARRFDLSGKPGSDARIPAVASRLQGGQSHAPGPPRHLRDWPRLRHHHRHSHADGSRWRASTEPNLPMIVWKRTGGQFNETLSKRGRGRGRPALREHRDLRKFRVMMPMSENAAYAPRTQGLYDTPHCTQTMLSWPRRSFMLGARARCHVELGDTCAPTAGCCGRQTST